MKNKLLSLLLAIIIISTMCSSLVVNAKIITIDEQFTNNPSLVNTSNGSYQYEFIAANSQEVPEGASGNVMKIHGGQTGGQLSYSLPTIIGSKVTVETKMYLGRSMVQFIVGGSSNGAFLTFANDFTIRNYSGSNTAIPGKTYTEGWHDVKVEVLFDSGASKYNKVNYYLDGNIILENGGVRTATSDITNVKFNPGNNTVLYVDYLKITYEVDEVKLETPEKPVWDGTRLSWNQIDGAAEYSVDLYKDSLKVETIKTNAVSYNMNDKIYKFYGNGSYSATVTALGNGNNIIDSSTSEMSESLVITDVPNYLSTPNAPLWEGNVLKWNHVNDATAYLVKLYLDSTVVERITALKTSTSVDMSKSLEFYGSGKYTATITALGDGENFNDSLESERSVEYSYEATGAGDVLKDTFDVPPYTLGSVIGQMSGAWEGSSDFKNVTAEVSNGELKMTPSSGSSGFLYRNFERVEDNVAISLDIYIPANAGGGFAIASNSEFGIQIAIRTDGSVTYRNATTSTVQFTSKATYIPNAWNKFVLTFEKNKSSRYNNIGFTLNGTRYYPQDPNAFCRNSIDAVDAVAFNVNAKHIIVDNILVNKIPAYIDPYPYATNVSVIANDNGTLKGTYLYNSDSAVEEGNTKYAWYVSDSLNGTYTKIEGAIKQSYVLTTSEEASKYYKFDVMVQDKNGLTGESVLSKPVRPVFKPIAKNVVFSVMGNTLVGDYEYYHFANYAPGNIYYRWLKSDTENGQYIPVPNATNQTYEFPEKDKNKYFVFEVTVTDSNGNRSEAVKSVAASPSQGGENAVEIATNVLKVSTLTTQNADRITMNLNLPTRGMFDTAISWSSSDTSVIKNNGEVTQKMYGEVKLVTLTAVITDGNGNIMRKYFKLMVPPVYPGPESSERIGVRVVSRTGTAYEFLDVSFADWFYNDVKFAVNKGLCIGKGNGVFDPNGVLTVGESIIIAERMNIKVESEKDSNEIITRGAFMEMTKIPVSVLKGDGQGDLMMENSLTRAEACAILNRFSEISASHNL